MPSDSGGSIENAKHAANELSFVELRELRAHVDGLLEEKKLQEIDRLRQEMHDLGIDPRSLARAPSSTPSPHRT